MNRVATIVLLVLMALFIALPYGVGEEGRPFAPKQVRVYSTLHNSFFLSEIIIENDIVYMKMEDILNYTNYNCDYNLNDKIFTLMRGKKRIIIDYNDNTISYPPLLPAATPVRNRSIYDQIDDRLIWNDELWLPVYPTFSYLNSILEINQQDNYLLIKTAKHTLFDFMFDFSEVLKDERYSIYSMIYHDSSTWVEKNLYRSALGLCILLDVVENAEFLSISRDLINSFEDILGSLTLPGTDYGEDSTYFSRFYREILMQILGGSGNTALQLSLEEKAFKDSVSQTLTYSQNSEFYNNLPPLEQKKLEAGGDFLTLVGLLNTAAEVSGEYSAIYDLQESSVRLFKDAIINRGKRDSNLRESMLYREANYIVEYFESPSTVEYFHTMGTALLDDVLTGKVPPFAATALTVKGVTLFYDYSDMLPFMEGIPRDLKKKTIADSIYYEIQQGIRKIYFDIAPVVLTNINNTGKEQIDGLYASALLYLKIKIENSANIYGHYNELVAEEYEKYYFVSREELYLDNPRLIEVFATVEDFLLLEETSDDDMWDLWGSYVNYVIVNVDVLRVRSGPGTEHGIIDRLNLGNIVEVIDEQGEWLKINYSGKDAWLHGDYVEKFFFAEQPFYAREYSIYLHNTLIVDDNSEGYDKGNLRELILKVFGEPKKTKVEGYALPVYEFAYDQIDFLIWKDDHIGRWDIVEIIIKSKEVQGPRGIRVGDPADSVISKYLANNRISGIWENPNVQYQDNFSNKTVELYYIERDVVDHSGMTKHGYCHYDFDSGEIIQIVYSDYMLYTGFSFSVIFNIDDGIVETIEIVYTDI